MNASVNNTGNTITHEAALELLPWLANETLSDDQKRQVEGHVRTCVACRRELSFLREVRVGIQSRGDTGLSVQRGLASVMTRIDKHEHTDLPVTLLRWLRPMRITRNPRTLQLAVAAQAACIGGLLWWALSAQTGQGDPALVSPPLPAAYQTLSAAGASEHHVWVRFSPQLNIEQLNTLLHIHGAAIVEGPRANDVYRLRVGSVQTADALRDSPLVMFASSGSQNLAQDGLGE